MNKHWVFGNGTDLTINPYFPMTDKLLELL